MKFPPEPLLSSALPERLWQKVTSDLFYWQGQTFLLAVDYFSRYVELAPLKNGTGASEVIVALKEMFTRHGIPDVLVSINGHSIPLLLSTNFCRSMVFVIRPAAPSSLRATMNRKGQSRLSETCSEKGECR